MPIHSMILATLSQYNVEVKIPWTCDSFYCTQQVALNGETCHHYLDNQNKS